MPACLPARTCRAAECLLVQQEPLVQRRLCARAAAAAARGHRQLHALLTRRRGRGPGAGCVLALLRGQQGAARRAGLAANCRLGKVRGWTGEQAGAGGQSRGEATCKLALAVMALAAAVRTCTAGHARLADTLGRAWGQGGGAGCTHLERSWWAPAAAPQSGQRSRRCGGRPPPPCTAACGSGWGAASTRTRRGRRSRRRRACRCPAGRAEDERTRAHLNVVQIGRERQGEPSSHSALRNAGWTDTEGQMHDLLQGRGRAGAAGSQRGTGGKMRRQQRRRVAPSGNRGRAFPGTCGSVDRACVPSRLQQRKLEQNGKTVGTRGNRLHGAGGWRPPPQQVAQQAAETARALPRCPIGAPSPPPASPGC